MILKISLQPIPNQQIRVILNNQACILHFYHRNQNLFLDFTVGETVVITGVLCITGRNILQYPTPYFEGQLIFVDNSDGKNTPQWDKLGEVFQLYYYLED